ncbi:MAG: hypothetical protein RIG84_00645 [Roseovarius sp.]
MKIKRNEPDLLVAEEVPWFMAIMLFLFIMCFVTPGVLIAFTGEWLGLLFALMGGGLGFAAMCVFVERLQLILHAPSGTATIRRRTILGQSETSLPLAEVARAVVESRTSSQQSGSRLSRPALVLEDGTGEGALTHPVTQVYSSGNRAETLVRAVNGWLEARQVKTA